ncbi:MAG: translation initiation factor IF-5A [Nanoarchaeota archaeon]
MVERIINATEVKKGTNILIDNEPFTVKKLDISKTGKHGHSKVKIEADAIFKTKREVFVVPGHEKLQVPSLSKRKGQILSIEGDIASVMDIETFETLEMKIPEELKSELSENMNVEFWEIGEQRIIKRKV